MLRRLETARLILRAPEGADADAIWVYSSDPDVTRHMVWSPNRSPDQAVAALERMRAAYKAGFEAHWAITRRDDGAFLGVITLHLRRMPEVAGLGYVLLQAHWGHGYATEAGFAAIAFARETLGAGIIEATCDAANAASARVLE